MTAIERFGETTDVAITMLVDNQTDLLARSTETVKYFNDDALLAEHGFAALVELKAAGTTILWDAGLTVTALTENMRRMRIDPAAISAIALSHGHDDHTAAVTAVLKAAVKAPEARPWEAGATIEEIRAYATVQRLPLVVHPAAFRERWRVLPDGTRYGPNLPPPRAEWEAAGAEIILSEGPYRLGPGCWTTGAVPRLSFEQAGTPPTRAYRDGDSFIRDSMEDDQALVVHVAGKGLVVLAGCAHAGIVNTVRYAREISGVEQVHAILGGFHLAPATDEEIAQTVAAVKGFGPALIVPSHCTGFRAVLRFAVEMPQAFRPGLVGAKYLFG